MFYLFTHFILYCFIHNFYLLLMFISWIAIPWAKVRKSRNNYLLHGGYM